MEESKCPKWCTTPAEHDPDSYMTLHFGERTAVYPHGISVDHVAVYPVKSERPGAESVPHVGVSTIVTGADHGMLADLRPQDARVIASVVEILSGATPDQQKEFAAGIRAAADAIEAEQSEPEAE